MRRKCLAWAVGALCLGGIASNSFATTTTGPFNGPLTSALLSVDLNGGLSTDSKPTEGWNGSFSTPAFSADQYGVTWSPWGGSNSPSSQTFGDGTVWPQGAQPGTASADVSAPAGLTNNVNYFGKTFVGSIHVSVAAAGTAASYGSPSINSRDRGNVPGGLTYSPAAQKDGDMFRDLIFGATSGSNVQGTNYLQVQVTNLTPGSVYTIATYGFDNSSANVTSWTATAPTVSNGISGWWAASPAGNNTFTPPDDVETIDWKNGANSATLRAPALFALTADQTGTATVWGFGGDGLLDQNASNTYLTGVQIAAGNLVPEPASLALLGLFAPALVGRRKR
jgi:hypothetical protein